MARRPDTGRAGAQGQQSLPETGVPAQPLQQKRFLTHAEEQWYKLQGDPVPRTAVPAPSEAPVSTTSQQAHDHLSVARPLLVSPHRAPLRRPGARPAFPGAQFQPPPGYVLSVKTSLPRGPPMPHSHASPKFSEVNSRSEAKSTGPVHPRLGAPPAPRTRARPPVGPPPRRLANGRPPAPVLRRAPPLEALKKLRAQGPPKHSPKHEARNLPIAPARGHGVTTPSLVTPDIALAAAAAATAAAGRSSQAVRARSAGPSAPSRLMQTGQTIMSTVGPTNVDEADSGSTGEGLFDSDWVQLWDEEVESNYYYNQRTGEASWIRPDDFREPRQPVSTVWNRYWDEEAKQFYIYNSETGESRWVLDEGQGSDPPSSSTPDPGAA
mmetsp:Transcript_18797/g.54751  ORF Transcript_18797/g.54751 Transcript_18797/m.54751 type:complete len:380 (-) Transcript_18797:151-1290(-)